MAKATSSLPALASPRLHPHPQGPPAGAYLLHVVLGPLHHQVHVGEPKAALEILQALLKQDDFNITRFHLHGIQWEVHKLVQMLCFGEGGEKMKHFPT